MRKAVAMGTLLFSAISFKYSSSGELRMMRRMEAFFSSIKDEIMAFLVMLEHLFWLLRVGIFSLFINISFLKQNLKFEIHFQK